MSSKTRKRPRWYIVVAILWFVLLTIAFAVLLGFTLSGAVPYQYEDAFFSVIVPLCLTFAALAFAWTFWVVPVLGALDIPANTQLAPSKRRSSLLAFTMTPGVLTVIFAAVYAYTHSRDGWTLTTEQRRAGMMFIAGAGMMILGILLGRLAIRRLRRASAECRICYACGYDLRGSPSGDCPECGFTSERVEAPANHP